MCTFAANFKPIPLHSLRKISINLSVDRVITILAELFLQTCNFFMHNREEF